MSDSSLVMAGRPGSVLLLGREIARGGEGVIHELTRHAESVAKLYNSPLTSERIAKLRAMVGLPRHLVPADAAWPSDLIVGHRGSVLGFVMPRICGRYELHTLLSGASRRATFPLADYRMLVATAANLARAVAAAHAAGHVIGDVNERCALVGSDATVKLIDCDSWQIELGNRLYTCDVGTPMYQPSEMQGVGTFRGYKRIRNFDAFGLAVLIFQLLFFGRHPFAGRPAKGEAPELPEAIRSFKFAWEGFPGFDRPSNVLQLSDVGARVASYFRRAFGRYAVEEGRPRAAAWVVALEELRDSLRHCAFNTAHWYLGDRCPICELEHETRIAFFLGRVVAPPATYSPEREANALWAAIEAEAPPSVRGAQPVPSSFQRSIMSTPYPEPRTRGWIGRILQNLGLLEPSGRAERVRREREVVLARRQYDDLVRAWRACDPVAVFNRRRADLKAARDQLTKMFENRHQAIAEAQYRLGLQQFLAACRWRPESA